MNLPADVANQSLDAAGVDFTIGDMEEGTKPAQVLLRAYGQNLRQLLRAANWSWARKQAPLVLLADATGQTPNVGTLVPQGKFIYEYSYPIDAAKIRFIPWQPFQNPGVVPGNIGQVQGGFNSVGLPAGIIPQTTATALRVGHRLIPAPYVIANDPNYPSAPGQIFWEAQGTSPTGSTVILCNVKNAQCVYTTIVFYPSMWDSLFREALVALLAANIAVPLSKDKKFGLSMRKENIEIAKAKIKEARVVDGNEASPSSSDIAVDWMRTRRTGGWGSGRGGFGGDWGGDGGGYGYGGHDALMLPDGSNF
jgi:hypothetical protein